jgi:hypothetical protein
VASGVAAAVILSLPAAQASPTRRPAAGPATIASAPTLGLASVVSTGEGFGRVRPRTVSYGGDPTSLVSRIKWASWGGARAVGHGVADWVWPGWCVACGSVELPATVVAFGLTTCQGHSAYSYVEWYFPSRGMSFDRRLAGTNVCGLPSPPTRARQLNCGHVQLHGAVATHITMYNSPISCAAARRFVRNSTAARHLGRDARFRVRHWWCGSELSMDLGGPQSFSCVRGDFANVSFDLKP